MINEWDLASMSRSVVHRAEEMCVIDRQLEKECQRIEKSVNEKWKAVQQLRKNLQTTTERINVAEPLRGDLIFVARSCLRQMSLYTQSPIHLWDLVEMVVTPDGGVRTTSSSKTDTRCQLG
jgi:hypothetical protein